MSISIRSGIKEVRNRIIAWLDKDTGLPRSSSYWPVSSGVSVTEESAMRVTAVFACVRIISWTIASLPFHLYRRLSPRGKERAPQHRLYALLHDRANPEQTGFHFRALVGAHLCLWGNGYAEIERDPFGEVKWLWPIPPWRCEPRRTEGTRELYYEVTLPNGTRKNLQAYNVWHVMGLSVDGLKGLSPIGMAREAVGLSMAAETFGASFFGHGLNVGGIVQTPQTLSEPAFKRLKEDMNEKYEGLGKAHRLMLLEEGMKYEKVGINPNEAQFLETRKFQVADIARLYGVPPHMVGDTEKSTSWGTGIEQQGIGFVVYTMRPYLVQWEQETSAKLLYEEERDEFFPEFAVDGLLRGDIKSRYASYAVGRQWGWLSVNDVRELENLNPIEGGDKYITPLNMTDATKLLSDDIEKEGKEDGENQARSLSPIFTDVANRILRREEADVMRQARKLKPTALRSWLAGFYMEHRDFIITQLSPSVEVAGLDGLAEFSEEFAQSRYMEIDGVADDGVDALQARFNETRSTRIAEIVAHFTGGTI